MKKVFSKGVSLVIAAVMCLALLPMTALAADSDFLIENGVLLSYQGEGGDVVIPNSVTSIYTHAFGYRGAVTSVIIPDSVTNIDNGAFTGCGATSITIGKNVKTIGNAFSMCQNLTSIIIPDSVTSLGHSAFQYCESLKTVQIGNGLTEIEDMTFYFCDNLESVIIGNGVKSIGNGAFAQCTSLENITIPDNITSIDDRAFDGCTSLTGITIGNGVTSIGTGAFSDCTSLTSITIPDSVTSMGTSMFSGCTSLENVTLGNGLTQIESGMFNGCTSLKSLTIPDSVTSINDRAFGANLSFTVHANEGSYAQEWVQKSNENTYVREVGALTFVSTGGTAKPTEPTTPTTTEKPSGWAEEQVNAAISNSLVPQDLQAKYTQATTRAEFAALAVTLYEQATGTTITERVTFSDTTDINVQKAAGIGVVNGVGDNRYDPNAGLTREQAAAMLSRLADATGKPLTGQAATFADNASVGTWALEAVGQMQASGIMGGVGNNAFDPKD